MYCKKKPIVILLTASYRFIMDILSIKLKVNIFLNLEMFSLNLLTHAYESFHIYIFCQFGGWPL